MDIPFDISMVFLDPARVPVAMAAWLLAVLAGMVTGPMHGNANPFLWMISDKTLFRVAGRLDRRERKKPDLLFRGFLVTVVCLLVFWFFGDRADSIARRFDFAGTVEIIFLSLALTAGSVWFVLLRLYFAMKEKKPGKGAYYGIARSTRTDFSASDDYGITRAGMVLAARSFDKGLVAPVFWYLLLGLPGAFIYTALAALAWRFGKDGCGSGFGDVMMALEKLMGFVPHILAGLLMAMAGLFTPTGGMTRAFAGQILKKGKATYDQGGLPVTAMAYALDVSLGGPVRDLDGDVIKRAWVGPDGATAKLAEGHLRRAIYISLMAHLLFIAGLTGGMFWGWLLF